METRETDDGLVVEPVPEDIDGIRGYIARMRADFDAHNHDGANSKSFRTLRAETVSTRAISIHKTSFADTVSGFWAGFVNSIFKFILGSETSYLSWDGSTLSIVGRLFAINSAITTDFESTTRFSTVLVGDGTVSFGVNGAQVISGTANPGAASLIWKPISANVFKGSPVFSTTFGFTSGTSKATYMGLGDMSASTLDFTDSHIGFKVVNSILYATVADGSTETSVSIATGITSSDVWNVVLKVNQGNSVDFYYRRYFDGSSYNEIFSGPITVTTNIPTEEQTETTFRTDNQASTTQVRCTFNGATYTV